MDWSLGLGRSEYESSVGEEWIGKEEEKINPPSRGERSRPPLRRAAAVLTPPPTLDPSTAAGASFGGGGALLCREAPRFQHHSPLGF